MPNEIEIYIAGDNLLGTKYYRKAIIVGQTTDLYHRQCLYTVGKGMPQVKTGDLVSFDGRKHLPWPFLAHLTPPPGITDKSIHMLFETVRPFKDFVTPIKDVRNMHTKEAFRVWSDAPLEEVAAQLQRLIIEYLVEEQMFPMYI